MHSFRSAGGNCKGGDEVHESQLQKRGGELLSLWEKLLNDDCKACEISLSIMYFSCVWFNEGIE